MKQVVVACSPVLWDSLAKIEGTNVIDTHMVVAGVACCR